MHGNALAALRDRDAPLVLRFRRGGVTLESWQASAGRAAVHCPLAFMGGPVDIALSPNYLTELLRAAEYGGRPLAELDPGELLAGGLEEIGRRVIIRVQGLGPGALGLAQALAVLGDGCELRHAAAIAGVEMAAAARLAEAPASFQPRKAATRRGDRSFGVRSMSTKSGRSTPAV